MTKYILDSGNPKEYWEISEIAQKGGHVLWGGTTNPTLIAKQAGKKMSRDDAQKLQKDIIFQLLEIVPGAVSAEVYADENTIGEEMAEEGRKIAAWHKHVVVKLPTTLEGFKARTILRKEHIPVNNTLVFSQEQIFAICLHEMIIQETFGPTSDLWPPFISPFIGRLDDIGEDGSQLVEHGMKLKKTFHQNLPKSDLPVWMLAASIRNSNHMKRSVQAGAELVTAPAAIYREWFLIPDEQKHELPVEENLKQLPLFTPLPEFYKLNSIDRFMELITSGKLSITHPLTEKGLERFASDWKAILT